MIKRHSLIELGVLDVLSIAECEGVAGYLDTRLDRLVVVRLTVLPLSSLYSLPFILTALLFALSLAKT